MFGNWTANDDGRIWLAKTAAIAVFAAVWIQGCSSNPALSQKNLPKGTNQSASPSPKPKADLKETLLSTAGKTLIHSKKGRPWMMEVMKIVWNDGNQKARIENVDWTLTDKKGANLLRVQAPAAAYLPQTNQIEFEGKVTATRYKQKDKIFVNHLRWDGKKSKFYGSKGVRWERGTVVVTGQTLECPDTLETVHLEGNVQATEMVQEGFP